MLSDTSGGEAQLTDRDQRDQDYMALRQNLAGRRISFFRGRTAREQMAFNGSTHNTGASSSIRTAKPAESLMRQSASARPARSCTHDTSDDCEAGTRAGLDNDWSWKYEYSLCRPIQKSFTGPCVVSMHMLLAYNQQLIGVFMLTSTPDRSAYAKSQSTSGYSLTAS